ncbi:MAG: tRNA epoxyqueuosine(34) reductase QueG [Woeseiaceae bacterium]|nr:tRNA epoxyqueuosine(34) reductase QueG [Woeseiaceae bacterium]
MDPIKLKRDIEAWAGELGFQGVGVSDTDLARAGERLNAWLDRGYHGEMAYMQKHGSKRYVPAELVPDTIRIISVRMDYLAAPQQEAIDKLDHPELAYVSRYALGRDYHKVLRSRLQKLAQKIEASTGPFGYRVFVDSAPVLEKPIAEKAGLGWIGKHTNLINRIDGSWFFLGELYTDLPLPVDEPASEHCGSCRACIDVCPTDAIVAPYKLDAKRCISYLTIEHGSAIPEEFRKPMGNRIYGCDDCQLFCPWNKFAKPTGEADFAPRHGLDNADLADLATWGEETFLTRTEGSAIRRIGHERFQRNIAVALGNAERSPDVMRAIDQLDSSPSSLVREHANWAKQQHDDERRLPD